MLDMARRLINPSARSDVPPFMVMDVMAAAARIEAAGGRVIHLEVGQPAAAAPASAIAGAHAALASGRLRYTETLGIATLRARIAKKAAREEDSISLEYIQEVARAYEHFFFRYAAADLLVVNTSEIDFVDDLIGSSFKVHNPNATASCGCGTSFSI